MRSEVDEDYHTWFRWCSCADPNVLSSEEKFTPLHFCARYLPRVAEKNLSEAEEQTQRVDKRSSSWRAISYLINLKGDNKVEVKCMVGCLGIALPGR